LSIYNYISIGTALLLTLLVLVQSRGASLGAGLGGSAEVNTVRRGSDKSLHQLTIITAVVFAGSIILGIV